MATEVARLCSDDDRIAVFDNDGTLWSEQPIYFQLAFVLDRVKAIAPKHPEWKTTQPFKAVLDNVAGARGGGRERPAADHGGDPHRNDDR